jgi:3-oxoacyl-[acyl-carrier-protein] synthase II
VVGTSRGSAAGWLSPWPGRRPFRLMAASNTIHSEPATAVSIELGIGGPVQVLASGCAAGLDAIGIAMMMIRCGVVERALAVAVDLPLVPMLLDSYAASGLLASRVEFDPYRADTCGFIPSEASAAMAIEVRAGDFPRLLHYASNSDARDPVGVPMDGGRTPELLKQAMKVVGVPQALCPHATGTRVQALAEAGMFRGLENAPSIHLLKPMTGHAIGASGLLESVILGCFLREGELPPNLPGLAKPPGFVISQSVTPATGPLFKLSHGMGGHNSLLVLHPS